MLLRRACVAMGTRFELVLAADGPGAAGAADRALEVLHEEDQRLSAFQPSSLPGRLARAGGKAVRVDDELLDLLDRCLEVHEASEGAFDPTVGAGMEAWGFRGPPPAADPPAPAPGMKRVLHWDRGSRRVCLQPPARLDFGAVGKGWALDRAAELLREAGVRSALLHGGTSTVLALEAPPGTEAWRVAVAHPDGGRAATVELRNAALSVSAIHGRQVERDGRLHGHVLDPRSGTPSTGTLLAAVRAGDATRADAWSTALLVLGRQPAEAPLTWALLLPEPDA